MNEDFWKRFPPIPGFSCVEMKRRAQEHIYDEVKGMSSQKLFEKSKMIACVGRVAA